MTTSCDQKEKEKGKVTDLKWGHQFSRRSKEWVSKGKKVTKTYNFVTDMLYDEKNKKENGQKIDVKIDEVDCCEAPFQILH